MLLIAAAAGFVIVPGHQYSCTNGGPEQIPGVGPLPGTDTSFCAGWSHNLYDAALIATWAFLIVGALVTAIGLINYARPAHTSGTPDDTR